MKKYTLITLAAAASMLASCNTTSLVTEPITGAVNSIATPVAGAVNSVATPIAGAVTSVATPKVPVATSIEGEPNMVISPYAPYNKIDVSGYKSGDKVGDPSTVKADGATGKSNLRVFLLP